MKTGFFHLKPLLLTLAGVASLAAAPAYSADRCDKVNEYSSNTQTRTVWNNLPSESNIVIRGQLYSRLLKSSQYGETWGFQLQEAQLFNGEETITTPPHYSDPFAVQYDSQGLIVQTWHRYRLPPEHEATLVGLVRGLQYDPLIAPGENRQRTERDGLGDAMVEYGLQADGWFAKKRVTYEELTDMTGSKDTDAQVEIVHDDTRIQLNDCWIESADAKFAFNLRVSSLADYRQNSEQYTTINIAKAVADDKRNTVDLYALPENPDAWGEHEGGSKARKSVAITPQLLEELQAELTTIALNGTESIGLIRTKLKQYPEAISQVVPGLLSNEQVSESFRAELFGALGSMDAEQVPRLLLDVAENEQMQYGDQLRAMIALGSAPGHIDSDSIDRLWQQWNNKPSARSTQRSLGQTSVLTMGSIAATHTDTALANTITKSLTLALEAEADPQNQAQLITALGNTGNEQAAESVRYALDSNDGELISSAITALGRIGLAEDANRLAAEIDSFETHQQYRLLDAVRPELVNESEVEHLVSVGSQSSDRELRVKVANFAKEAQLSEDATQTLREMGQSPASRDELQLIIQAIAASNVTNER